MNEQNIVINCKNYNPNKKCNFACEGCTLFEDDEDLKEIGGEQNEAKG